MVLEQRDKQFNSREFSTTCDTWESSLAGLGKKQGPQHLVKSDSVPFLWRPFSKCPGVQS